MPKESQIFKKIYQKRKKTAKKYDFGLLLVIGGSKFYSGSPAFSAMSAFKAGVDMVHILAPERSANIIASFSPNLATYPLKGDFISPEHLPLLFSITEKAQEVAPKKVTVVIGGGIGREKETQKAIVEYLSEISLPAVIDADAIYAISQKREAIKNKNFLITPHSFEFFALSQENVYNLSLKEKIKKVKEVAGKLRTTILLKGAVDIVSDGKEVLINKTGNPFLTVGGTGDTLAGIAGAFLCRGVTPLEAGFGASYLNGLAGELASKKLGESLLATDLIEAIPKVLKTKILKL